MTRLAHSIIFALGVTFRLTFIGLAVVTLLTIVVAASAYDWLHALLFPPSKSLRLRIVELIAQCRHRLSFAGGLFVAASPA